MTTPAELYGRGIRDKLKNYFAAWLPNVKMRLGDFGTLDGDLFTRIGTLSDLGISFKERPDPDSAPIDYVSESGVSIFVKAAGETSAALSNVPEGRAGIGVEFSRQGAFILKNKARKRSGRPASTRPRSRYRRRPRSRGSPGSHRLLRWPRAGRRSRR